MLDVGERLRSCQQIQRQVGFRAVLGPGRAAADLAVAAVEVHRQLTAGRAAVADRTMLQIPPRAVDDELVVPVPAAAERDDVGDIVVIVFLRHRNGDHDLVDLVVPERDLRLDVDPCVMRIVEMLADLPGKPPVFRHKLCFRSIDCHTPGDALIAPAVSIHPLRDVRGLFPDMLRDDQIISADRVLPAEPLLVGGGIAHLIYGDLHECRDVLRREVRPAGDLAAQGHELILDLHFKRIPGLRGAFDVAVEDEGRDEVRELVRMSGGHPFRSLIHWRFPPFHCLRRGSATASRTLRRT